MTQQHRKKKQSSIAEAISGGILGAIVGALIGSAFDDQILRGVRLPGQRNAAFWPHFSTKPSLIVNYSVFEKQGAECR